MARKALANNDYQARRSRVMCLHRRDGKVTCRDPLLLGASCSPLELYCAADPTREAATSSAPNAAALTRSLED